MSVDLHARVDNAIARVTASRAAAEVLAISGKTLINPACFGKIDGTKRGAGTMLEASPGVASSVRSTRMRRQLTPFLTCKHCRGLLPRDAFDDEPRPGGGTSGKYDLCRECRTKVGRTIRRMPLSVERLDDGAIRFSLSQGQFAIVDADDAPAVLKHKWSAKRDNHTWYAHRAIKLSDGSTAQQLLHHFIEEEGSFHG